MTIARDLQSIIRGDVRFSRHDRMLYSTDASIYQVEPIGIVVPRTREDTSAVIEYARDHGLAVLPRGGGTSLAGQAVSHAIIVDCSQYQRRILEVDPEGRTCRVEAGVVLDQLNRAVAQHGLMFGPDVATASHATIGGMIGNNSAGAHSILYGRTVEHLRGVEAVLPDGTVTRFDADSINRTGRADELTHSIAQIIAPIEAGIDARFPKIKRHVDGYNLDLILDGIRRSTTDNLERVNLSDLICGSEGTLAMILEAELALVETPPSKGLAVAAFSSVDHALEHLPAILATSPSAVELLDDRVIALGRQNVKCRAYVDMLPRLNGSFPGAVLYIEYFGGSQDEIDASFEELRRIHEERSLQFFTEADDMRRAWALRRSGEPLLHAMPGHRKPIAFVEDLAVDPQRLGDFVREFRRIIESHGTQAAFYAHASVGCLHIRPMIDLKVSDDVERMQRIAEDATRLITSYQGALSGEHGDGRARSHLLEKFYGKDIIDAFAAIKTLFDPDNRFNPGVIVDPASMTESWRVRPEDEVVNVPEIDTYFRYEPERGFGEAVEQCNGAGVCRRMTEGAMCPSYRATLDERHATRGRGNALRLAITGQLGSTRTAPVWNDAETLETLDLCLSCKACKAECPSNVDIAKLKAEYIAQSRNAGRRTTLFERMTGNIRAANRLGARMPGLANFINSTAIARMLSNRLLGIDPRRSLPKFQRSLFQQVKARKRQASSSSSSVSHRRPTVLLFADCFNTYNEPHVGMAAIDVLEACGYRVIIPDVGCCGRAQISLGLLETAQKTIARTARTLERILDEEDITAILTLEPSCCSAILDDWLDLTLDADRDTLQHIAARTHLAEDFLEREWNHHPRTPNLSSTRDGGAPILLHGHCHQKALWGVERTEALLRRVHGGRVPVTTLDTGCCGMAGAFGFTRDHYDLSMKIGELSLFPPLRENPDAHIAAPGTSCRHQILDALGRHAVHPIELVRRGIP